MSNNDDDVERVARAIYPLFAGFVTGRAPVYGFEDTLEDNREAARELARAALSAMPERELLREALDALQLIANCIHPRFRTEDDIDLLYANEKAFGQCINVARAAADKIRAALEHQP